MRKSKIVVTLVAVILVGLLLSVTTVFSDQDGVIYAYEQTGPSVCDSDGDGLEDGLECVFYGTDPLNPDTDGDGLLDCEEISNGWNPCDPNDPCSSCDHIVVDYEQVEPSNGDSDGDGLEDGLECVFYGTDPLNPDTDGDGLLDCEEISNGWNPRDSNDPYYSYDRIVDGREQAESSVCDSDGDGLEDGLECVFYGTDPLNPDTDGDGLLDCEEISNGYDPLDPYSPCTNCGQIVVDYEQVEPSNGDSDGDGLEDGLECVFYGTNPLNPDTDGDEFTDYEEISNGWNPLDPNNP